MAKTSVPRLKAEITPENWDRARRSDSGGCLVADAIKAAYPQFSTVTVDMATIRATDRKAGYRYIWLTPETAQTILLAYDQGWSQPFTEVKTRKPVQIVPITRTQSGSHSIERRREASALRLAELEAKEASGEPMTPGEKSALTKLRNPKPRAERPAGRGPAEARVTGKDRDTVIHGGRPVMQGKANPNLLRGRNRHFGAKMAAPGLVFQEAVDQAVAERLAQQS